MERIYAVSDIHGHIEALTEVLSIVSLEENPGAKLIFLGDYIDRGADSCAVLELIRDTQKRYGDRVIALAGNHEQWFIEWLDSDVYDPVAVPADPALLTIGSFVGDEYISAIPREATGEEIDQLLKHEIRTKHSALIEWLRALPLVFETEDQIFVHAGVDELAGAYWREVTPEGMFTNKYPAEHGPFLKTVIAGHVRTNELHDDDSNEVFHDGYSHYYIDGAVEETHQLNLLKYETSTGTYSWQKTT